MRCLKLMALSCLVTGLAHAQSNSPPRDVAAAVLLGVSYFRSQALTNAENWLFHPLQGYRVKGYENRTVRYKEVTITIPGQKLEPYEVMVPGATPGEPMRSETRYRSVGRDPSKDTTRIDLVQDPNGPIAREERVAIYEKDEGSVWRYGALGNNGLAILALRRCGVAGDDPLVVTPGQNLAKIVATFGLPDNTRNLAGLTAGFAVLPGEEFKNLTERCAAKLMDAQIVSGPGTGLWGPVAVSTPMASAYLKLLTRLGDEKKALQADLAAEQQKRPGGKPTAKAKSMEEEIKRLDARLEHMQSDTHRITQLGFSLFGAMGNPRHGGRITLTQQADSINIDALPYVIQNQISADLDSTALAILALRVAFENGRLPAKTWRPDPPKPAGPGLPPPTAEFPPPRTAAEVLALAARAITAARNADGLWPELNIHQPVSDFAWLKSIPQIKPEAFPKLRQPVTVASTAAGAASLANIAMLQAGATRPTVLENPAYRQLFQDMLAGRPLANSNDVARAPFDVLQQTTALHTARGKSLRTNFEMWNEVADWLVSKQNPSGSWGSKSRLVLMPSTGLAALQTVLPPIKIEDVPTLYDKPHLNTGYTFFRDEFLRAFGEVQEPYFTMAALLFLADGLPDGWSPR